MQKRACNKKMFKFFCALLFVACVCAAGDGFDSDIESHFVDAKEAKAKAAESGKPLMVLHL